MAGSTHTHRRKRVWQTVYIGRLNVCYWKKTLKKRESISVVLKCVVAVVVFGLTVSPLLFSIGWGPALVSALITLVLSFGGIFVVNARTTKVREYCRQWSELRHDAEVLWQEGEDLGWNRKIVVNQMERLDGRMRAYQANELEDPKR